MHMTAEERRSGRIAFLDAARGVAMFFVLLSHFSIIYFQLPDGAAWAALLNLIGMIASPTFTVVSGLLLGFLYATKGSRFAVLRDKFVDRGLFLLTVGHVIVAAAQWHQQPDTLWSFVRTDCIGASIVAGALMIARVSGRMRLALGVGGYLASWLVIALWHPSTIIGTTIERVLFGDMTATNFPFVPWFSLYIASTVLGESFGRAGFAALRVLARKLAFVSGGGVALAFAFAAVTHRWGPFFQPHTIASNFTWIVQKYPPGPVYMLFYGGLAIAIVAVLIVVESRGWPGMGFLASNGQASFFIFAVHPVLLDVLSLLPSRPSAAWPIYFVAFYAAMSALALMWERSNGNRFMTVAFLRHRWSVPARLEQSQT